MRATRLSPIALMVVGAGCSGPQSALDPAGPAAQSLHTLGIVMYAGATAVTLLVALLMLWPFVRPRERPANRQIFLWGGGVLLPSVTLLALIPYAMMAGSQMRAPDTRLSVDVTGFVYWWEMSYRQPDGTRVTTANELRLPVGEPVELLLRSDDVIHGFWVPALAGKTDVIPGRVNRMVIEASQTGVFRGQCAEFCGAQHAMMAFDVIVVSRAEFDAWLQRHAKPVTRPRAGDLRAGHDLFLSAGCGSCHAVRGISIGQLGPDLTNVGARLSLAAGAFPNNIGTLAGWIVASQHLKPGNRMPNFSNLQGQELRALAGWLESLK